MRFEFRIVKRSFFVIVAFGLLCPSLSWAQLGQSEESTVRQWHSLNLQKAETHSARRFHYKQLSSDNLVVKQYVNPNTKTVFGVTWQGTSMPNLLDLLGFDPQKVIGPSVRSLHYMSIRTDSLRIEMITIMGHYTGSAVRTDLLPKGVPASEVTP